MGASCRNADTMTDEVNDATTSVKECVFVVTETKSDGTLDRWGYSFASSVMSEGFFKVDQMMFMGKVMLCTLGQKSFIPAEHKFDFGMFRAWTDTSSGSLSPNSSVCRTPVSRSLTTMSRWAFRLDLQRVVDQRCSKDHGGDRARSCPRTEHNVAPFFVFWSVRVDFVSKSKRTCVPRGTHKLPSGMSERTEVPSGTPGPQGCWSPVQGTRLLEVKSTRLLVSLARHKGA